MHDKVGKEIVPQFYARPPEGLRRQFMRMRTFPDPGATLTGTLDVEL